MRARLESVQRGPGRTISSVPEAVFFYSCFSMPARQPLSAFNRNVLSRLWRVRVSRALRAGDVANWLAEMN